MPLNVQSATQEKLSLRQRFPAASDMLTYVAQVRGIRGLESPQSRW